MLVLARIWAPKGTPKESIAKLNAAVVEALDDPRRAQRLAELGHEVAAARPADAGGAAARFQKAEIDEVVADHQGREHQERNDCLYVWGR